MFRGPSCRHRVLPVLPQDLPARQTLAVRRSRGQHTRNGQHRFGRVGSENPLHRFVDATVELSRCGSRRHGEIQSFDATSREKLSETPQGRLGLPRSGFRFEDGKPFIGLELPHNVLGGIRSGEVGQFGKGQRRSARQMTDVESDLGQDLGRSVAGHAVVLQVEFRDELEKSPVRPDPISECCEPGEKVNEKRLIREIFPVISESVGKPSAQRDDNGLRFRPPIVARKFWPVSVHLPWIQRPSMVRKAGSEQRGNPFSPLRNDGRQFMKRMLRTRIRASQKGPTFRYMPLNRPIP